MALCRNVPFVDCMSLVVFAVCQELDWVWTRSPTVLCTRVTLEGQLELSPTQVTAIGSGSPLVGCMELNQEWARWATLRERLALMWTQGLTFIETRQARVPGPYTIQVKGQYKQWYSPSPLSYEKINAAVPYHLSGDVGLEPME